MGDRIPYGSESTGLNFIGAITPGDNFRFQIIANLLDGEYTDYDACFPFSNVVTGDGCAPIEGQQLQRQPKERYMLTPSYRLPLGWGELEAFVTYTYVGDHTQDQSGLKNAGRGYHAEDLEALSQLGMASGCTCALIMALYVDSANVKQLYRHPELIWLICPIILYQMARIWFLARRGQMPDDPLVFMIRDWRSQFMGLLVATIMVAATVLP